MAGRLGDRIALVTGASRGIGYFSALALAREGAHVIAVARTVGGLEELDDQIRAEGGSATLVPLDLADFDALDRLGASIDQRWGRLDILFANAAVFGGLSPIGHFDPKVFDKAMAVNVTANWRLIRSLDPLMKASPAGRAIFVSSAAAHGSKPFWGVSAATKAAMEALARTWASESAATNLKVNILIPGPMRTAMRAQAMPGEDPASVAHPSELGPAVVELASAETTRTGGIFDFPTGAWT